MKEEGQQSRRRMNKVSINGLFGLYNKPLVDPNQVQKMVGQIKPKQVYSIVCDPSSTSYADLMIPSTPSYLRNDILHAQSLLTGNESPSQLSIPEELA